MTLTLTVNTTSQTTNTSNSRRCRLLKTLWNSPGFTPQCRLTFVTLSTSLWLAGCTLASCLTPPLALYFSLPLPNQPVLLFPGSTRLPRCCLCCVEFTHIVIFIILVTRILIINNLIHIYFIAFFFLSGTSYIYMRVKWGWLSLGFQYYNALISLIPSFWLFCWTAFSFLFFVPGLRSCIPLMWVTKVWQRCDCSNISPCGVTDHGWSMRIDPRGSAHVNRGLITQFTVTASVWNGILLTSLSANLKLNKRLTCMLFFLLISDHLTWSVSANMDHQWSTIGISSIGEKKHLGLQAARWICLSFMALNATGCMCTVSRPPAL